MGGSRTRTRTTYTMVKLELSKAAYEEIKAKLIDAGYQHTFLEDFDGGEAIDMTHIAVAPEEADEPDTRPRKRMDLPFGRRHVAPSAAAQEALKRFTCETCDNHGLPHLVNNDCELYWEHHPLGRAGRSFCSRFGFGGSGAPRDSSLPRRAKD